MWNPTQYHKFLDYRARPALDLIKNLPDLDFKSIIDLGCGLGNITQILYKLFPNANLIGIDNSQAMLERAQVTYPEINWQLQNITELSSGYDLIFSTAALQWVENHQVIFPKILAHTNKTLAIQMPTNYNYPSHVLLRETIAENQQWVKKLTPVLREKPVLNASEYFNLFNDKVKSLDIWETEYLQQLTGENPVLEWVRGTALVPIAANLDQSEFDEFVDIYNAKLLNEYKMLDNGITLFPFKRIFILANK